MHEKRNSGKFPDVVAISRVKEATDVFIEMFQSEYTPNCGTYTIYMEHLISLIRGSKPVESRLDAMLRGEVLTALAVSGHDLMLDEASRRVQLFLKDRSTQLYPPDIRKATYVAVMQIKCFCL
ncbi:hypothetical protein K1719_000242 [Acacia pycnantha]|nr:hypothetical protein K1719_000242 [Acacia pycnantha]